MYKLLTCWLGFQNVGTLYKGFLIEHKSTVKFIYLFYIIALAAIRFANIY